MGRRAFAALLALPATIGCGAKLPAVVLADHPPASRSLTAARVVERSTDEPPEWRDRSTVGRGDGDTLGMARSRAVADLEALVARRLGVRIRSTFEVTEAEADGLGTLDAHQETRLGADRITVRPIAEYWELVEAAGRRRYHCYVRSDLDERAFARLAAARKHRDQTVIILALHGPGSDTLTAELRRRLAAIEDVVVVHDADGPSGLRVAGTIDGTVVTYAVDGGTPRRIVGENPLDLEARMAEALIADLRPRMAERD